VAGSQVAGAQVAAAQVTGSQVDGQHVLAAILARSRANRPGPHVGGQHVAGAHVTGAQVTGAQVTGAQVTGAQVTGVHVAGAQVTGSQVAGAQVDGPNSPASAVHADPSTTARATTPNTNTRFIRVPSFERGNVTHFRQTPGIGGPPPSQTTPPHGTTRFSMTIACRKARWQLSPGRFGGILRIPPGRVEWG